MAIKKWFLFIGIVISNNLRAEIALIEESKNAAQEQETKQLIPVYIWPLYVSPLTLAQKDLFFTVAKLVEDKNSPGHFKIYPLFGVPTQTMKIPEALQEYFTVKIPASHPEHLLVGLKQMELPTREQHYIIPVKELQDLTKIQEQFPNDFVILVAIPEDRQEFDAAEQKLKEENITLDPNTYDFLSSLSDGKNYIQIEELKDYIQKFSNPKHSEVEIQREKK